MAQTHLGFGAQGRRALVLTLALGLGLGCAATMAGPPRYDYFAAPAANDPWTRKIQRWQVRERSEGQDDVRTPAAVAEPGLPVLGVGLLPDELEDKYNAFRAEQKRAQARAVARWIQDQARVHYLPDGPIDRWATLGETLRQNGDDCDGLELLTFNLLRNLGFGSDEVFRAIVYRRTDGQHHMVTLWFENPNDPWVIDPTGAMTSGMPRMSEVPGWVPLKVFTEERDYTVQRDFAVR